MSLEELVEKYDCLKRADSIDLSKDQDLAIAVMNLIGIEEHLFFSGAKTEKNIYYDLIEEVRELRKVLLKQLIPEYEGEVWCISKHLLAASYRLMEVGTKSLHQRDKDSAYRYFEHAFKLYTLFWGVNLKLVSMEDVNQEVVGDINNGNFTGVDDLVLRVQDEDKLSTIKIEKKTWLGRINNWVKKALNCCKE